jgi:hypothetical protein
MLTDSDDLPPGAFTETELEAGVNGLYDSDCLYETPVVYPDHEIEPTVSQDEFIRSLVKGFCDGGVDDVEMEQHFKDTRPFCGVYGIDIYDDWPDAPDPRHSIRIAYQSVPVTFVVDALRLAKVPLITNEATWLAWDADEERLKFKDRTICGEDLWSKSYKAYVDLAIDQGESPYSTGAHESYLVRLLDRSAWSTDHGKKPLLLRCDSLIDAMLGGVVEFDRPHRVNGDDIGKYVIAFYDPNGKVRSIPLADAAELGLPIYARNSTYTFEDGSFLPRLNYASLLAGAFLIAIKFNPNEFQWFRARGRGTLFQSSIERIAPPRHRSFRQRSSRKDLRLSFDQWCTYETTPTEEAHTIAMGIAEESAKLGSVYLTVGSHPLNDDLMTTPDLYQHAIKTLDRFGYAIEYDSCPGVRLHKK